MNASPTELYAPPVERRVVVITGLSGAGRTQAAKVLEDLDFFVIDNLPPSLIGKVNELAFGPGSSVGQLAIVVDVRSREFFGALDETIKALRDDGVNLRIVYLEADEDTLVRRFETTRRRHPAAQDGQGVVEGIRAEREMMSALRGMADLIVDTTDLNVHELRDKIVDSLGDPTSATLRVKVESFGFKYGAPRDADIVMDVRFLPNPHWVEELRPLTGKTDKVRDYVFSQDATGPFVDALKQLLDVSVPGYVAEGKRYLTIAIGCTGGKHRSVAVSEEIGRHLRETTDLPITVDHRDLGEE